MATQAKDSNLTWGNAILAAFAITLGMVLIFGFAPSHFVTTVQKSYAQIPNSGQSRFIRDMVSQNYYLIVLVFLGVAAYNIQKLSMRKWRIVMHAVAFGLPTVLFVIGAPAVHGIINMIVTREPEAEQAALLYTLDEWVYTLYFAAAMGLIALLTPIWWIGLKKLEARVTGADRADRTSAYGRPVTVPAN